MRERIERKPALTLGGVVTENFRRERVRAFVNGYTYKKECQNSENGVNKHFKRLNASEIINKIK